MTWNLVDKCMKSSSQGRVSIFDQQNLHINQLNRLSTFEGSNRTIDWMDTVVCTAAQYHPRASHLNNQGIQVCLNRNLLNRLYSQLGSLCTYCFQRLIMRGMQHMNQPMCYKVACLMCKDPCMFFWLSRKYSQSCKCHRLDFCLSPGSICHSWIGKTHSSWLSCYRRWQLGSHNNLRATNHNLDQVHMSFCTNTDQESVQTGTECSQLVWHQQAQLGKSNIQMDNPHTPESQGLGMFLGCIGCTSTFGNHIEKLNCKFLYNFSLMNLRHSRLCMFGIQLNLIDS